MTSPKTSIIFVAGAWHTEFHLQPITPYLKEYGYRVVPVKLCTSNTARDPPPTIQDNIHLLKTIIETEIDAGYSIILIAHSIAGQSVACAVDEFLATANPAQSSKILHIIFIACFLNALRAFSATEGAEWWSIDYSTLNTTVLTPYESFYQTMTREAAAPFVAALDSHRSQMPPEGIADLQLWKTKVKGTYFLCRDDRAILPDRQRPEAEENGMRLVEVEGDHCPFISRPEEFAGELYEVLRDF